VTLFHVALFEPQILAARMGYPFWALIRALRKMLTQT
jgi:hypothetical protein